jgi:regulatory protein YycH of two-component signal transduction system YycFG
VEIRVLRAIISKIIAKFLWEDIIYRHGIFRRLIIDGDPENKDLIVQFVTDYNIKRVVISPYNTKINKIIKKDHKSIVNALAKMTKGGIGKWVRNLYAVLWVDRIIVRKNTGYTLFYLNIGMEAILLIKFNISI